MTTSLESYIELSGIVVDHCQGPGSTQIFFGQLDEIIVAVVPEFSTRLWHLLRLTRLKEKFAFEVVEFTVQIRLRGSRLDLRVP